MSVSEKGETEVDKRQPIRIFLNYDAVGHSADRDCRSPGEVVKVCHTFCSSQFWCACAVCLLAPRFFENLVLGTNLVFLMGRVWCLHLWFPVSLYCFWSYQLGEPSGAIHGSPECNSHLEPPIYGDCWYNCTSEDITGEDKKIRLHEVYPNLQPLSF